MRWIEFTGYPATDENLEEIGPVPECFAGCTRKLSRAISDDTQVTLVPVKRSAFQVWIYIGQSAKITVSTRLCDHLFCAIYPWAWSHTWIEQFSQVSRRAAQIPYRGKTSH